MIFVLSASPSSSSSLLLLLTDLLALTLTFSSQQLPAVLLFDHHSRTCNVSLHTHLSYLYYCCVDSFVLLLHPRCVCIVYVVISCRRRLPAFFRTSSVVNLTQFARLQGCQLGAGAIFFSDQANGMAEIYPLYV